MKYSVLVWNINGVKEKFENDTVKNLFHVYDILIIMETHFMKRHKCPENFKLVSRSTPLSFSYGRGGVAVYTKKYLEIITKQKIKHV